MKKVNYLLNTFRMIKIEHTIFALPFAFWGALLGGHGKIPVRVIFWIFLAMVGARSAAMAFNRVADLKYDRLNPRTKNRELPSKKISREFVVIFIILSSVVFIFSAYKLNPLSFYLSFPALFLVLFYSYTKRFTHFSHFVLGFCLGIAPAGGWIAVTGSFDLRLFYLAFIVMFWVAGFDIIYSCQDWDFDTKMGLYSFPSKFGVGKALKISSGLHVSTALLLLYSVKLFSLGKIAFWGFLAMSIVLIFEHFLVDEGDLSKVNIAFFNLNGLFSVGVFFFTFLDYLLRG